MKKVLTMSNPDFYDLWFPLTPLRPGDDSILKGFDKGFQSSFDGVENLHHDIKGLMTIYRELREHSKKWDQVRVDPEDQINDCFGEVLEGLSKLSTILNNISTMIYTEKRGHLIIKNFIKMKKKTISEIYGDGEKKDGTPKSPEDSYFKNIMDNPINVMVELLTKDKVEDNKKLTDFIIKTCLNTIKQKIESKSLEILKLKREVKHQAEMTAEIMLESTLASDKLQFTIKLEKSKVLDLEREKEKLKNKNLKFKFECVRNFGDVGTALKNIKEYIKLKSDDDKVNIKTECKICMDKQIDVTLGCGHVLCTGCSDKVTQCPYCKEKVKTRIKIFI